MNFEIFKKNLVTQLTPVKPTSTPGTILLRMLSIEILFIGIILFFSDSIPLQAVLHDQNRLIQIIVLPIIICFSSYTFLKSSIPGEHSSILTLTTLLVTLLWPLSALSLASHTDSQLAHPEWICSILTGLLSIVPLIASYIILSGTSLIFLGYSRFYIYISSGAVASLILCFLCSEESFNHLLYYHMAPVFIGSLIVGQILFYKRNS
jgi:hypothetical protein